MSVTDGAYAWRILAKSKIWNPTTNTFNYETGWDYINKYPTSAEAMSRPRGYCKAEYRIPGMGGWNWRNYCSICVSAIEVRKLAFKWKLLLIVVLYLVGIFINIILSWIYYDRIFNGIFSMLYILPTVVKREKGGRWHCQWPPFSLSWRRCPNRNPRPRSCSCAAPRPQSPSGAFSTGPAWS